MLFSDKGSAEKAPPFSGEGGSRTKDILKTERTIIWRSATGQ